MLRPTTTLQLCFLMFMTLPLLCSTSHFRKTKLTDNNYVGNNIVSFTRIKPSALRNPDGGIRDFTGALMTLEQVRGVKFAYVKRGPFYIASPSLYRQKCAQIVENSIWRTQKCQLPPRCGITTTFGITNGWFSSETACLSMFTNHLPNSTQTTFTVKHEHDWAQPYNIIFPSNYTNKLTKTAIGNYKMLHYPDDTFQVVSEMLTEHSLGEYDNNTGSFSPMQWSIQGKSLCYHTPQPLLPHFFPRTDDPDKALYATRLILDDSDNCPIGYQYIKGSKQLCTVQYDPTIVDIPCAVICDSITMLNCDPDNDTFSPPGFIQSSLMSLVMWSWDLLTHSLLYLYTGLIKSLEYLWYSLNKRIYMAEYTVVFLVATIVFRSQWAGLATAAIIATYCGLTRY